MTHSIATRLSRGKFPETTAQLLAESKGKISVGTKRALRPVSSRAKLIAAAKKRGAK